MKIILALVAMAAQISGSGSFVGGYGGINGWQTNSPTISGLTQSADANAVVLSWTTSSAADSRGSCGSEQSVDNGVDSLASGATSHQIIVAGLTPSTQYTCTVQSGATAQTISATTSALPSTTPITGLSIGAVTQYLSGMNGDTWYNADQLGITYFINADTTTGCSGSNVLSAATMLEKFTSLSPLACTDVNQMTGYGACCTTNTPDRLSPKGQGLISVAGVLYMTMQRTDERNNPVQYQYGGSIIASADQGKHWNNLQNVTGSFASGQEMTPPGTSFFDSWDAPIPPFNVSTNTFVMYGADDGTRGYTVAANREDNANAYVYLFSSGIASSSGSSWNNSDKYYLMRVPRSRIGRLFPPDYQFFVSGDGSLDSNWSSSPSSAGAVVTNTGKLSIANIQFIPALNRYLLLTFYYPVPATAANSAWLGYEAPHPWGPWTQIYNPTFTGTGYYDPIVLQDSALSASPSGTSLTVLLSPNYQGPGNGLYYATMAVSH